MSITLAYFPFVLHSCLVSDEESDIAHLAKISITFFHLQVDLLKHGIPDPSSLTFSHPQSSNLGSDKETKEKIQEGGDEYMASPVFIHTK